MVSSFLGAGESRPSSSRDAEYLGELLALRHRSFEELGLTGSRLERLARRAIAVRDLDFVEQIADVMLHFPLPGFDAIGLHYAGVCLMFRGRYAEAKAVLEAVVGTGPVRYQGRTLHALGTTLNKQGRTDAAQAFFVAAARLAPNDLLVLAESHWEIANIRAREGSPQRALRDFERIGPLVRILGNQYPRLRFDFLNDVAFALGEACQVEEALRLSSIPASSPLAPSFPYWIETKRELEEKREATPVLVSISRSSDEALSSELETARAPVAAAPHTAAPASINEQAAEAKSSELQVKVRPKRAVLIALAWPFIRPANRAPVVFLDRSLAADDEPTGGVTRQWFSMSKSRAPPRIVTFCR